MNRPVSEQVVVITGASSGIGRETALEFGKCGASVSDIVHAFPEAIDEMARSIKATIQSFEPRLTDVTVRQVPSEDLTLRYTITARLREDRTGQRFQFETSVDASRRLTIR